MTEEIRQNISKSKLGTTYKSKPLKSEEHRKKISDAIKKKWQEKKQCGWSVCGYTLVFQTEIEGFDSPLPLQGNVA